MEMSGNRDRPAPGSTSGVVNSAPEVPLLTSVWRGRRIMNGFLRVTAAPVVSPRGYFSELAALCAFLRIPPSMAAAWRLNQTQQFIRHTTAPHLPSFSTAAPRPPPGTGALMIDAKARLHGVASDPLRPFTTPSTPFRLAGTLSYIYVHYTTHNPINILCLRVDRFTMREVERGSADWRSRQGGGGGGGRAVDDWTLLAGCRQNSQRGGGSRTTAKGAVLLLRMANAP